MVAVTFQLRVEDLIGSVGDTTALTSWLTEEARKITDLIPEDKLLQHSDSGTIDVADGIDITDKKVVAAHVGNYRAELVDYADLAKYNDSNSIHYATVRDPVAYIVVISGVQSLRTAHSGGDSAGTLTYFLYPTVAYDDISISDFPFELERLVVLGTAIRGRIRQLTDKRSSISLPLSITVVAPIAPDAPSFSYTNATASNITEQAVSILGTAPTYTAPLTTISGTVWATAYPDQHTEISTALGAIVTELNKVDDIVSTTKGKVDDYYTDIGHIDDTTELWDNTNKRFTEVSDALTKARSLVDETTMGGDTEPESIQYWLNDRDSEMAHATITTAQLELQRAGTAMSEIENIMSSYKLDIEGVPAYLQAAQTYIQQARGYSEEVQSRLSSVPSKVSEYQAKVQDALNTFNKENVEYQARLQAGIVDAQNAQRAVEADAGLETDVSKQNKLQDLSSQIQEYTAKVQKYSAEIQGYAAEVNTEVQDFINTVQGVNTEHQMMSKELQELRNEYDQGLQLLIGAKKGK